MEKDNVNKVEINVNEGAQVNIINDNARAYVAQNNSEINFFNIKKNKEKFQNDKKKDYIKKWNSRLFLHQYDDVKMLTLANTFIMPDFKAYSLNKRMGISDGDTLARILEKLVEYNRSSNMLIAGVPGIGKSSITSWIANKYKEDVRFVILRFRDWEKEELKNGLLKAIYTTLDCKKHDLDNKILIIDGFDEMKSLYEREHILNTFLNDIKDFKCLKCIITSRPAYIDPTYFQNVFKVLPFDFDKIKRFYFKITNIELDEMKLNNDNFVLRIPAILYLAIMSKIDITDNVTKPELYNHIFAEKGGIFDRLCIDGVAYDEGSHPFRNSENIKKYLIFLQRTAYRMFENDTLTLKIEDCDVVEIEFHGNSVSVLEFPINFFENQDHDIEFIHKSIYEYFVSEYIYLLIENVLNRSKNAEIDLANVLGTVLCRNVLSKEIIEFLRYKFKNDVKIMNKLEYIVNVFKIMLQNGMTYYMEQKLTRVIECELNAFSNMLILLHFWEFDSLCVDTDCICDYLRYRDSMLDIDLSKFNLEGANLYSSDLSNAKLNKVKLIRAGLNCANFEDADLRDAELVGAKLINANFGNADLTRADLRNANLKGADFREAEIKGVKIKGAKLEDAVFDEDQIKYLKKYVDLHGVKVYVENADNLVRYEKYRNREWKKNVHSLFSRL